MATVHRRLGRAMILALGFSAVIWVAAQTSDKVSVVRIVTDSDQASGVVISIEPRAAVILTVSHALKESRTFSVFFEADQSRQVYKVQRDGALVGWEPTDDTYGLAAFRVSGTIPSAVRAARFGDPALPPKTAIDYWGYPEGARIAAYKAATISAPSGRNFILDRPLGGGASGGGLFKDGRLVGIAAATGNAQSMAVGLWAIPGTLNGWGVSIDTGETGVDSKPGPSSVAPPGAEAVDWKYTAGSISGHLGQAFLYRCPAGGSVGRVWGTDIYLVGSSICSAAVHMGLITATAGGVIAIMIEGPQENFRPLLRNGVASAGISRGVGFKFVKPSGATGVKSVQSSPVPPGTQGIDWKFTANSVSGRLGQTFSYSCPPGGSVERVWGTDSYLVTSSICSAAVHMGLIKAATGGVVSIIVEGPQENFRALVRNGVASAGVARGIGFRFLRLPP